VTNANKLPRRDALASFFRPQEPTGVADLANAKQIAVDLLDPNPFQPRTFHDDDAEVHAALGDLTDDIRAHGVLQPLLVRPHPLEQGRYQIVAGERRWRAACGAGLKSVPTVERVLDDAAMERLALTENIQRADLDPVDEARAYRRLMDRYGVSLRDLAAEVHKHHEYIAQRLRLLEEPRIAQAVQEKVIGPTVGQELARVKDPARRDSLLDRAARGERVTVQDAKAAQDDAPSAMRQTSPKVSNNSTDHLAPPTSPLEGQVSNNSTALQTESVRPPVPRTDTQALHAAFAAWCVRVDTTMADLSVDDRQTLALLVRKDIDQLLDRLTTR